MSDKFSTILVCRLKRKLDATEQAMKINGRWQKTDVLFQFHFQSLTEKRRLQQLTKMRELAREWQFLLDVKRRHTGTSTSIIHKVFDYKDVVSVLIIDVSRQDHLETS